MTKKRRFGYIIYPKDGISAVDKAAVKAAIEAAVAENPALEACTIIVRHSWRTRVEKGREVFRDRKSYVIQFYRNVKRIHIDRNDPDTPEEVEWNKEEE